MSLGVFLALVIAGGAGAAARYTIDALLKRDHHVIPLSTLTINVTGSFLLGLIVGLTASGIAPDWARPVLGTGFLGGYTTFSTASVEAVRLADQHSGRSLAYLAASILSSSIAAGAGLVLAGLF